MDTVVKLYACYDCGKQVFLNDMKKGQNCRKCASNKFRAHQPTFWWRLQYLIHTFGIFGAMSEWLGSKIVPAEPEPIMKVNGRDI